MLKVKYEKEKMFSFLLYFEQDYIPYNKIWVECMHNIDLLVQHLA